MQDIRCDHDGCNKLLARIIDGRVELFCPRCKAFHVVQVVEIVSQAMNDLRNGHETPDKRLLW